MAHDEGGSGRRRDELASIGRRGLLKTTAAVATVALAAPPVSLAQEVGGLSDSDGEGRILEDGQGPPYGGGPEYVDENGGFTRDDADYVVETLADLVMTVDSNYCTPQPGEVIYVPEDAEIDTGTRNEIPIPPGVILASNRGADGSDGGLIYTDAIRDDWPRDPFMLSPKEEVRVTGIRIRGKYWDQGEVAREGSAAPHDGYLTGHGLSVSGSNVEVDNCELYGFAGAAVSGSGGLHVHHCDIHDTLGQGLGYGVSTNNAEIHHNTFNRNRHAIACSGASGSTYTAHHNVVGNYSMSHMFDVHRPGGERFEIFNNTFRSIDQNNEFRGQNKKTPGVAIRGTPDDVASITDNWFYNPAEPRDDPNDWTDEAIIQVFVDEWTNVEYSGNQYGTDSDPPTSVGAPGADRVVFP